MLGLLGMIPGKGKIVILLVLALAVAAAVGYHFWKVNSLNTELGQTKLDLQTAIVNQARLEEAVGELQSANNRLVEQRATDQVKLNRLAEDYQKSQAKVGGLRKKLSEHDLEQLMLDKPGLLQGVFNKGTIRLGEEFEALTGGGDE